MWAPILNNVVAIAGLGMFIWILGANNTNPHTWTIGGPPRPSWWPGSPPSASSPKRLYCWFLFFACGSGFGPGSAGGAWDWARQPS